SAGQKHGVTPGTRYAVYHALMANREPNVSFGEAVVVSVAKEKTPLRITEARGALRGGGTLVRPVGVVGFVNNAGLDGAQPILSGEGSAPQSAETPDVLHTVSFDDVSFDFDKFTLKPETFALLDQAVQVMKQNPTLRIKIEGYSCNIGTVKYNMALGKRRANA